METPTFKEVYDNGDIGGSIYAYKRRDYNGVRTGDSIHFSPKENERLSLIMNLHDPVVVRDGDLFFIPDDFAYGDYTGSTLVERANVDVFLEDYGHLEGVHECYGSYGYRAVAIRADIYNEDMLEAIQYVQECYPLLSDVRHSELQIETLREALDEWIVSDTYRELLKLAENYGVDYAQDNGLDVDRFTEAFVTEMENVPMDVIREIINTALFDAIQPVWETSGHPYVDTDEMASVVFDRLLSDVRHETLRDF